VRRRTSSFLRVAKKLSATAGVPLARD